MGSLTIKTARREVANIASAATPYMLAVFAGAACGTAEMERLSKDADSGNLEAIAKVRQFFLTFSGSKNSRAVVSFAKMLRATNAKVLREFSSMEV